MSIDQGKPVIIVLLDLSTAFDHNILFFRLKDMFSLSCKDLNGFDPNWNNAPRECLFVVFYQFLLSGVQQGLVVGPLVSSWDHCATIWG